MNKQILLPNNDFGCFLMFLLIVLVVVVPLVVVYWLTSLIAPMFISVPVAILVSVLAFVTLVKFK